MTTPYLIVRDLTSGELHNLDVTTPVHSVVSERDMREADGPAAHPALSVDEGETGPRGDGAPGDGLTLDACVVGEYAYVWDDETRTYWLSIVVGDGRAHLDAADRAR